MSTLPSRRRRPVPGLSVRDYPMLRGFYAKQNGRKRPVSRAAARKGGTR